jgi:ubiquinone/menaquinone biosynthesis C-methylase UbiE
MPAAVSGSRSSPKIDSVMKNFHEINELNQQERDEWVLININKYFSPDTSVLDVGAGTSPYKQAMAHCKYIAQDFGAYDGIKLGDTHDYGEINIRSDILEIPLPDGSIDNLICTEVLEHVPNPLGAIQEFSRLLRPGGVALITAPFTSGAHQEPYHFYSGFSRHFYEHAARTFGFDVLEIAEHGGFLRLMAQEVGRISGVYQRLKEVNYHSSVVDLEDCLLRLANEMLQLDPQILGSAFSIGFHVVLRKHTVKPDVRVLKPAYS